ncbi:MAG: transcription termination/antitermination factor NusG [Oscillospiraceae bacterium]|jgi:transcriptional antiterminator NusG|nr:transcription termination/antitermination factor NusG [Oscillospiraceae bacterium]
MSEESTPKAEWYVIHTYSGYENKVAQSILTKAENQQLTDKILEVQIPTEQVQEVTDGKTKEYARKIYPGYVLVHMVHTNEVAYLIRSIRGVTGFLGADPTHPQPLTDSEVAAMGVDLGTTVEINLSVGDSVRVVGTAMDGFTGVVQSIDIEEGTCEVLVSMFGQETPTKLKLTEVTRDE